MSSHNYGIILAGGEGSTFWPLCRKHRPIQFLQIGPAKKSLLRLTYERLRGVLPQENILVVTLARYRDAVMELIPELPAENLLLEPYGRNTAPCIAYATYSILKRDPQAVMAIAPADNLIEEEESYRSTFREALDYAATHDALITIGIVPNRPDTNYGYIQVAGGKKAYEQTRPVKVKTFTEKPDPQLADVFLRSGEFLWNSGIFLWKAQTIRAELEKFVPSVTHLFRGWESALGSPEEERFLEKVYMNMERISIDYAVMENTDIDWVFPAAFHWADISNWDAACKSIGKPDADGNVVLVGQGLLPDSRNCILNSDNKDKLLAVSGLENYIIIDTDDVLMICPRDEHKIKDITAQIGLPGYEPYR
ncbi:MAG: mannose-1-phosphate guanylyltransferase [Bacteroidales bacterium]|nr:mannose-1-phosphate guanylyltransferase [Bacteroidales bacterium]